MLGAFGMGFRGIAGPARSAMAGYAGMAGRGARALSRSPTGVGAVAGAAWGMASDDTSVIGGAMMGGALGRYGAGPLMGMAKRGAGWRNLMGVARDFGRTAFGRMDYQGARIQANQGYNKIRGIYNRAIG